MVVDPSKPVIIRDDRMKLFYSTEPYLPNVKKFNLPAHIPLFLDSGNIKTLPFPMKIKLKRLPFLQRFRPKPDNFKIVFQENPNKCSILWGKKMIVFDNSFLDMSLPDCFFILYHEFGHHLYKTEEFADAYARNMMLKKGFNKSQIGEAIIFSLSEKNIERKEKLVNSLIN